MSAQFKGPFWVIVAYLVALVIAILVGRISLSLDLSLLWSVLIGDIAATIALFLFSYAFNNSSFYDPYWSVQPIVIAAILAYYGWDSGADLIRILIMLLLVTFWGVRLTYNWARGWQGLRHQDWRYVDLQEKHGFWYWPVSFLGIHLMPTVLVFLGCLALFPTFTMEGYPLNFLDILAGVWTLAAIFIELTADEQLRRFVLSNKENPKRQTLQSGLWAHSRHPNYFGEAAFWWGLYLFALAARPDYWWVVAGPLSITLLFHFISIPMIEKRMIARRSDYAELIKRIPRWIPWRQHQ